jgi:hypothetical protein
MTDFQKVIRGLQIFEQYLSPKDNPGWLSCVGDDLCVGGVHRDALGGDDRVLLEALGWEWDDEHLRWSILP